MLKVGPRSRFWIGLPFEIFAGGLLYGAPPVYVHDDAGVGLFCSVFLDVQGT